MSSVALAAVPDDEPERGSWAQMLRSAIRSEFAVDVYVPDATDRVLFGALCAVSGCPARGSRHLKRDFYLCVSHGRQWQADDQPSIEGWVLTGARPLKTLKLAHRCSARGCPRSVYHHGLCYAHLGRWNRAGRPDLEAWARSAAPVPVSKGSRCRLPGCRFPAMGNWHFCDTHHTYFSHLRTEHPDATPGDFLERAACRRLSSAPRFDLRGLPEQVALEMRYGLQCRHDARQARLEPAAFRSAVRWVRELGVESLLDRSGMFWAASARERYPSAQRNRGTNPLGSVRYVRARSQDLREQQTGVEVWQWDRWPFDRLNVDARYAHQPERRIYFTAIDPPWLRALAKRWARWRITSVTLSPAGVVNTTNSLRAFCRWLQNEAMLPGSPDRLTRSLLERYLSHVHSQPLVDRAEDRPLGESQDVPE